MDVAVVGAGPTGLFMAVALARRGHRVTVVDRDPGPAPDGSWERRGVMQFHHPHGFRPQIHQALQGEMPEVLTALDEAGAERVVFRGGDGLPAPYAALRCRRALFEQVLRAFALAEPGVTLAHGHVDDVLRENGRAAGLRVDGRDVSADLVVNASGRASRIAADLRAPAEGGDCGLSYVSRQYSLLPGAEPGPMNAPVGIIQTLTGYLIAVFLHDHRTFSALFIRPADDRRFGALRFPAAFQAAALAVPALAAWVSSDRSEPITPVLPGGRLHNTYRGQLDADGRVALPGLLHVGDSVCTTNPSAGRGIAVSLRQAVALLNLLDAHPGDPAAVALAFDEWCLVNVRPWYEDHVYWDTDILRRWAGGDVDVTRRLPSDLIMEASEKDQSLLRVVGPYMAMEALPSTLDEVEPQARALFASGWRPTPHPGPTRDELAATFQEFS
ncbi:FAD-dependent oxidoreductase [Paractinoplanes lichenicola]|uniref:FAD-dependent monooxygenase n=1 Tax=Paractinoplanes lichenicola TaxID=2802976 RepID=A0ABS1W3D3_9ACTN|nr:NAD(P)/FAD-dependent oxidoreductase [Actinoplanes lichenicola]MBL7261063.1 FAD-dependent monooxygenase [Actinoplanes lichenicola]